MSDPTSALATPGSGRHDYVAGSTAGKRFSGYGADYVRAAVEFQAVRTIGVGPNRSNDPTCLTRLDFRDHGTRWTRMSEPLDGTRRARRQTAAEDGRDRTARSRDAGRSAARRQRQ